MVDEFLENIKRQNLIQAQDKVLLTVSGGADSVAMAHLFSLGNIKFDIAHCNFKLRGADSDADEKFVEQLSEKYKVKFFVNICDAKKYAKEKNISIEMSARELRYNWFEFLSKEYGYTKIATAHHLNDSVETILLNLARKTGIRGLTGIPATNGKIIRPLLFASKADIIDYCESNSLQYRTDKTNFETDYQRNKIRHLIIPEFEKINSAFCKNIIATSKNISQYFDFFLSQMNFFVKDCVHEDKYGIEIDIEKLQNFKPTELFLYEYLHKYGFNADNITNIAKHSGKNSGKIFESKEYKLLIDRKKLIVSKRQKKQDNYFFINNEKEKSKIINKNEFDELKLTVDIIDIKDFNIEKSRFCANLDYDKLKFPLRIRKWEKGDYFYPFGMRGKKKLSDYFGDKKFSSKEKSKTWILESQNEIVWIINHRIDNRFRVNKQTRKVVQIRTINN